MVKFGLLTNALVSFQRPYNVVKLRLAEVESRVFFDEKNAPITYLLDTLNQLALLIINVVQLAWLFENFATQVQKVNIVARMEVFRSYLHCLHENGAMFHATFGQQDQKE